MRAKILNASAGSGKTYQLAYKYIHDVIERPELYRHILAVTFTNKATEEMKSRILREIHLLATGDESPYAAQLQEELGLDARTLQQRAHDVRSHILHDYSHFTVLTIDTFFQRILRAFIRELGFDLDSATAFWPSRASSSRRRTARRSGARCPRRSCAVWWARRARRRAQRGAPCRRRRARRCV